MVNCETFADNTTLDASNTDPVSVENELRESINEVSDWCSKIATVLHPAKTKQKVCYLLRDKNSNFAHLILISVSKLITLSKFMNTDILASLLMMNSAGSHTLYKYARQCQKALFYYLSSNSLWTLPSASYFIMLTFLLILHMPPLSAMDVVIFYSKNLILFIEELQS